MFHLVIFDELRDDFPVYHIVNSAELKTIPKRLIKTTLKLTPSQQRAESYSKIEIENLIAEIIQ
jgi:hypothetical protein